MALGTTLPVNSSGSTGQTLIEHWDGTSWNVVPSPNAGGGSPSAFNELFSVAAVSANNIWAVGEFLDPSLNEYQTLTEHWDGTSWSVIPSPNATAGRNYLAGVTALSTGDVVAVGGANSPDNQTGTDLILANNEPLGSAPVPPANPPPGPTPSPGIIDYVGQQSIPTTGLSPVSPSADRTFTGKSIGIMGCKNSV